MTSHSDSLVSYFGYWPDFADGKILELEWEASGHLRLVIHYIDANTSREATVGLRFAGVTQILLSELRSENVLDALVIQDGNPISVELDACFGVQGTFNCASFEVMFVNPNSSISPTK